MKDDVVKQIIAKRKNVRVEITLYKDKDSNSVFLIRTKRLSEFGKIIKTEAYLRPETFLMLEYLLPLFLGDDIVARFEVLDALSKYEKTETKLYRYQNPELYK